MFLYKYFKTDQLVVTPIVAPSHRLMVCSESINNKEYISLFKNEFLKNK